MYNRNITALFYFMFFITELNFNILFAVYKKLQIIYCCTKEWVSVTVLWMQIAESEILTVLCTFQYNYVSSYYGV